MSIIESLADNACGCIQNDIQTALDGLSSKATKAANKLTNMITGALNNPINAINSTVLETQNALATGFENELKGAIKGLVDSKVGTTLNSSCFLKPFADFNGQVDAKIGALAGLIKGLDFSIPTVNLNFQIAMAVNICGQPDTFSGPLASILSSAGLSATGAFDIAGAFSGMVFPPGGDYEAMFKETVGSLTNISNMQGMVDNVVGAVNERIDAITGQVTAGIDAVKDWGNQAAKTVNEIGAAISDPSKALAEIQNRIPLPGAVAWAAQFAGVFGFAVPGIAGGGNPKRPRDVNFLTKKVQGDRVRTLLQLNAAGSLDGFRDGSQDSLAGFHETDISTDAGLGKVLKTVMGMKDSTVSDEEFARAVKNANTDITAESVQAQIDAQPLYVPDSVANANTNSLSSRELQASLTQNAEQITRIEENRQAAGRVIEGLESSTEPLDEAEQDMLARAKKSQATASVLLDRANAERTRLETAASPPTSPLTPLEANERLSALYKVPPDEARFSTLRPIPGTGEPVESVRTGDQMLNQAEFSVNERLQRGRDTEAAERALGVDPRIADANRNLNETQARYDGATDALFEARLARANQNTTPEEKASLDDKIATISAHQTAFGNQMTQQQSLREEFRRDVEAQGPPSSNSALSSLYPSGQPTRESLANSPQEAYSGRLMDASQKREDFRDALQRARFAVEDAQDIRDTVGLSQAERHDVDRILAQAKQTQQTLQSGFEAAEQKRLAILHEPPTPVRRDTSAITQDTQRFEAIVQPTRGKSDGFLEPDSVMAQRVVDRARATIEAREITPPPWLNTFLNSNFGAR